MRFLVDECTGSNVAKWLQTQNYEVFSVFDEARGMKDKAIIEKCYAENWILITNDKDFGEKIYRQGYLHRGVIFLRLSNQRSINKINVLKNLLRNYIEQLHNNFIVVTENQIRFARN